MIQTKTTILAAAVATLMSTSSLTYADVNKDGAKEQQELFSGQDFMDGVSSIGDWFSSLGPVEPTDSSVSVVTDKDVSTNIGVDADAEISLETLNAVLERNKKEVRNNVTIELTKKLTKKLTSKVVEKQAGVLRSKITKLLQKNKVSEAGVIFYNIRNQLQLSFGEDKDYDVLFKSIKEFNKNNPMIGSLESVSDVDMQEYIIRQGVDRLMTTGAVGDLVYLVGSSKIKGDSRNRLLSEINYKAGNLTIALLDSMKIKEKTTKDKMVIENIANGLIAVEKSFEKLMEE
jgi:hypothetical protein